MENKMSQMSMNAAGLIRKLEAIRFELTKQENIVKINSKQNAQIVNEIEANDGQPMMESSELETSYTMDVFNAQIDILTKENRDLKVKCDKLFGQLRLKETTNSNLNDKVKQMHAQLENINKEKEQAMSEGKIYDANRLENLMCSVKSECDSLRNVVLKMQDLHVIQTEQTNLLKQDLDDASDFNIHLNTKATALMECNEQLVSKVDVSAQEICRLKMEATDLTTEITRLRSTVNDKNTQMERNSAKLQETRQLLEQEIQLVATLQRSLEEAEDAAESAGTQLTKAWKGQNELISRHDGIVKGLQQTVADLQNQLQQLSSKGSTSSHQTAVAFGGENRSITEVTSGASTVGVELRSMETVSDNQMQLIPVASSDKVVVATQVTVDTSSTSNARDPPTGGDFKRLRMMSAAIAASTASVAPSVPQTLQQQMVPTTTSYPMGSRGVFPPAPQLGASRVSTVLPRSQVTFESPSATRDGDKQLGALVSVAPPVPAGCCTFCREKSYGLMVKCNGCSASFHSGCMRKSLAARGKRPTDGIKGLFYCDVCSGEK